MFQRFQLDESDTKIVEKFKKILNFELECKQVRQVVILRIFLGSSVSLTNFVIVFALVRQQLTGKEVA